MQGLPLPNRLFNLTVWNTSKCNFGCRYCFVYKLYDIIGEEMDHDTIDALIHFASHHLDPNGGIWFFGGEPLTSFDTMKEIVDKAIANRVASHFGCTTNLYLLDEEKIRWMAKRPFNILASLDGVAETHDRHRILKDGSPTWERCWNNLRNWVKITGRIPEIRWTIQTADPEVLQKTPEAIPFFVEKGFRTLALDFVYEVDLDDDLLAEIRKMMERIAQILDSYFSNGIWVHTMMVRDAFSALNARARTQYWTRCGLAQGDVGVAPNGNIYPCHRFVASASDELLVGNVFKGFNENRVRLNEKWMKYPPYSQKPYLCLVCRFKNACHGQCIAMNYDLFGDIHIVPETACKIKDLTVRVFEPLVRKHWDLIAANLQPECPRCPE